MKLTKDIVVAGRYQLVDCLGAGAMGEVWRAHDTRFESRTVAVKFLREDETLKEDALNRDRLVIRLEQQAARGSLTVQAALEAIAAALSAGNLEGLRAKAQTALRGTAAVRPADVLTVFDELVNDPVFNDNARMRAKLRRLFRDEANAVANLRHDNIVSIFDYGDHDGSPYLVMDYIEGRTLYQVIQGQEAINRSRRLQFIEDLCAGLGYAHRHKLVHRDIKPANLIIDGSTGSLKILDFGVVRRLGSASTVGVPVGTFCYMSPEQTKGAATLDHRSDIFAVGLVLYELMAGRKAFPPSKSIGDLVARIQRDPPPSLLELNASIPKTIEDIINKAIQKQPENRYQDLSLMEREIGRIRAKIEATEQSEATSMTGAGEVTIIRPRPAEPNIADLCRSAEMAFEAGNDPAAIDLAHKALILQPGFAPALSLIARAETRQRDIKLREIVQQAEKLMAMEELTSARATLNRALEIDRSAPTVKAVEEKLDAAFAARAVVERAKREREQQQREQREKELREREQLREQREREQRERAERQREQREREQREREHRERELLREQREREKQEREQREREEREREQREREEREREQREREEREREQREREQRERETREREQREQWEREQQAERERQQQAQREREQQAERERQQQAQREREQRDREEREKQREQALRDLATISDAPADDEPTDVTKQVSIPGISRPPVPRVPIPVQPVSARPSIPVPEPPASAERGHPSPPRPAAPPAPPVAPAAQTPSSAQPDPGAPNRTAGPARKSKRYAAKAVVPPGVTEVHPDAPRWTARAAAQAPPGIAPQEPMAPPAPVQATTAPPRSVTRSGLDPRTLSIAAGIVVVIALGVIALVMYRSGDNSTGTEADAPNLAVPALPPSQPETTAPAPPSPTPPEPQPTVTTPPPATMTTVFIDVKPWARVKIVPAVANPAIPAEAFFAPFAIDLPPGTYSLLCENGGLHKPITVQLTVAEGGPPALSRLITMPGFNAAKIVESLIGQED